MEGASPNEVTQDCSDHVTVLCWDSGALKLHGRQGHFSHGLGLRAFPPVLSRRRVEQREAADGASPLRAVLLRWEVPPSEDGVCASEESPRLTQARCVAGVQYVPSE